MTLTCGVVVVELRGFEPLTPCMPSRDPRHSAHHEPSRSRALPQGSRAGAWWFVRLRRAELLRACCAKRTFICASIEASLEIVTSRCGPSGGAVRVGSGAQEANDPGWRCATLGDLPAAADHGRRQRSPGGGVHRKAGQTAAACDEWRSGRAVLFTGPLHRLLGRTRCCPARASSDAGVEILPAPPELDNLRHLQLLPTGRMAEPAQARAAIQMGGCTDGGVEERGAGDAHRSRGDS